LTHSTIFSHALLAHTPSHPQALLGLSYIHSRKVIHRDIKSLNLCLDAADNIKVRGGGPA
jgi:serine/threonine protein kinase